MDNDVHKSSSAPARSSGLGRRALLGIGLPAVALAGATGLGGAVPAAADERDKVPSYLKSNNFVRVVSADRTGQRSASRAIQQEIDRAKAAFRGGRTPTTVLIPEGAYKIDTKIVQPPYVKVVSVGRVNLRCSNSGAAQWWITPQPGDIGQTALYPKNEYTNGCLLDGSVGGINFSVESGTGMTGLELGSETNMTGSDGLMLPLSNYTVRGLSFSGFDTGIRLNGFNHYLAGFYDLYVESCITCVGVGSKEKNVNSGEDFRFYNCLFGSATTGFDMAKTGYSFDLNFFGCSFDFLNTVFKIAGGWQRVTINGGHIEAINAKGTIDRYTPTGAIVASSVSADQFLGIPVIRIANVPLVDTQRNTKFYGNMILYLDLLYRSHDERTAIRDADCGYLCDEHVIVKSARFSGQSGPAISRSRTDFPNPFLERAKVTAVEQPAAGSGLGQLLRRVNPQAQAKDSPQGGWPLGWILTDNGAASSRIVAGASISGGQAVEATLSGGSVTATPATLAHCAPGEMVYASEEYKFSGEPWPKQEVTATFLDVSGAPVARISQTLQRTSTKAGKWRMAEGPASFVVPAGAAWYSVDYRLESAGAGQVTCLMSGLLATRL